MEEVQSLEWSQAQDITFSIDLLGAAKQHLQFLEAVDNAGCLYDGPSLERAIYRYKNCWLPLLAKNMTCSLLEEPLVVPLDCEWIWHCHRLNPVQYKRDCEKIYGKVLGRLGVLSTTEGASTEKTESLWNRIYVTEPYNLDLAKIESAECIDDLNVKSQKNIEYDLVAAVKRQSSFFKVCQMMNFGDRFLEEAVSRYKGFLYLVKIIKERKLDTECVPTHDIDIMWHTHQLYPIAYCKDMKAILGNILDHNDRDSVPKKVEPKFARTKELWEEIFGGMYCLSGMPNSKWLTPVMDHVPGLGENRALLGPAEAVQVGTCWCKCKEAECTAPDTGDNRALLGPAEAVQVGTCWCKCREAECTAPDSGDNRTLLGPAEAVQVGTCWCKCREAECTAPDSD